MNKIVAMYLDGIQVPIQDGSVELTPVDQQMPEFKQSFTWTTTVKVGYTKSQRMVKRLAAKAIIYASLHS